MTKHPFIFVLVTCLLILSACLPVQPSTTVPNVETVVVQTLEAFTAAAPSPMPASRLPVSYNNVSFSIPLELNASASPSTSTDVEFPAVNPSGGPMAEHVVFQFTNFPIQGDAKIMVFKASEYAAYGSSFQDAVTASADRMHPCRYPTHFCRVIFTHRSNQSTFKMDMGCVILVRY